MTVPLLDLVAQHARLQDEVMAAVQAVIARQGFIMGPEVAELEAKVAALSGARFGVACASGTDALLLPLLALDLQPGDEVITTPFTFFASAGTIHNAGGRPVFADIDPTTFNVDPAAVEAAITPRTRAIVVVHLFGQMAPMERLAAIAERHGLALIEDAAQAIAARRRIGDGWRVAGGLGMAGALSFFPSKNLGGWGDGGMMLVNDERLAERLRRLRTHGGARQYHHEEVGTNSRLDTLQAAVLLVKLPYLAEWIAGRRRVAERYEAAFSGHPAVCPPRTDPANEHTWHQYTIRVPDRDGLRAHLQQQGIGCAVYYPTPLHLQPCFAYLGHARGAFPVSEAASASVLSLPVYDELTLERQERVIEQVLAFHA
ncbi:MAG: DegT/DnrJ/EryC1/StrS family aminotransferase [Gemmatimonadales bacterium]|nr:DegT/DnrJ/EryC1/StrS family aminotransferase [Gemmatimonadales bacterium]